MKRPAKWREIKKFVLELHPSLVQPDRDFCEATKELREATNKTASSESGAMRNTMKIPHYIHTALTAMDPDVFAEESGRNPGDQQRINKQLYDAFPEYRVARSY